MKRRAYIHRLAVLALLGGVAACDDGGGPGQPTDASTGGPDDGGDGGDGGGDGGSGDAGADSGVTVEFYFLDASGERVPAGDEGIAFPAFEVAALTMQLHRVELIGDTARPGDHMRGSWTLNYPFSGQPRIAFPSAPPGIYSRLKYRVELTYSDEEPPPGFDDERLSARVRGRAFVTQGDLDFEYWDDKKVDVDIDFNVVVENDPATIEVELDLASWFEPVNWQVLADEDDGGDDNSGPGGDDDGEDDDGEDDDGEDDNSGPGGGHDSDADIPIGAGGHVAAAMLLRDRLKSSFRVPQ
jgi:hypothetical protein